MAEPFKHPEVLVDLVTLRGNVGLSTSPEQLLLLRNAAQTGRAEIFRDHMGTPVGYVIWADVCAETAARFVRAGTPPFYFYEWDEGAICLVLDVVVQRHASALALGQLRTLLRRRRAVLFARRQMVKFYFKGRVHRRERPQPALKVAA